MSLNSINVRELRSFRFIQTSNQIKSLLENPKTTIIFSMYSSMNPSDRILYQEKFMEKNLKGIVVSKNIFKFLLKHNKWSDLKIALKGNLFLLIDKNNNISDTLNFIFSQHKIILRLLLSNHQLYKKKALMNMLEKPLHEKTLNYLIGLLYLQVLQISIFKLIFISKN